MRLIGLMMVAATLALAGCTAEQWAADEAAAYRALGKVEAGVDWLSANAGAVDAALDAAAAEAPKNATVQAAVAKAKAANTAGNRILALQIVQGAKVVLAPPLPAAPPGGGQ